MYEEITFALTSCGRPDLLERTIDSFLQFNTYPVKRYKVIDDSVRPELFDGLVAKYPFIEWTFNKERLGQSASIDILYDDIDTAFIYHCEDDWEFIKSGFIEESLFYMNEPKIIQCWLRGANDTNGHPLVTGEKYDFVTQNFQGIWHGFTFNPTLKRLSDYLLAKPYSRIGWETELNKFYKDLGFYSVSLKDRYVKHTGDNRHVQDAKG